MIQWTLVNSTAIRKVGYDPSTNRMYIDFEDSDPYYTYCDVPKHIFQQFVSANSIGRYYHEYIKDQYDC